MKPSLEINCILREDSLRKVFSIQTHDWMIHLYHNQIKHKSHWFIKPSSHTSFSFSPFFFYIFFFIKRINQKKSMCKTIDGFEKCHFIFLVFVEGKEAEERDEKDIGILLFLNEPNVFPFCPPWTCSFFFFLGSVLSFFFFSFLSIFF